ncbi:MAG: zinc transporter ZupT [Candidatus Goldbacteria bacterium]|nr:zinc transporter ZupT [Candidatus Goldiibacteriota bacterium]
MEINILYALLLSLFAGMSTAIGAAIAFISGSRGGKFLSFGLGLSAGVMVYVSFMEILPHSAETAGPWISLAAFFGGMGFTALIDKMIPEAQNPHEVRSDASVKELKISGKHSKHKLMRTGLFTAAAITIHNFPEGFATFAAAASDIKLGITIAIAVAIHNIPEGISVSVPIYAATDDKKKAFLYSSLSGLAEPVGALLGWLILAPFLTPQLLGIVMGAVAGIMIYISFDELLPTAREYGEGHTEIAGIAAGMAVMAVSLNLL